MKYNNIFINVDLPKYLSKEETLELFKKTKDGDPYARDKLIISNIRLVISEIQKKFNTVNYEAQDLISIGIIGLIKAINTYDINKENEFSTYATKCIDNEVLMFIRSIKKQQKEYSIEESAFYQDNTFKLIDVLTSDNNLSEEIVNKYYNEQLYEAIYFIINNLSERDREIIIHYYGFYDNERMTQKDLSNKYKISQSYISRRINAIILKISIELNKMGYIDLNDCKNIKKSLIHKKTRMS